MKLNDLEAARKLQQQSNRHLYFDDTGSIVYYGRAESEEYIENGHAELTYEQCKICLLYTSPSPRDRTRSRMPSSA